MPRNLFAQQNAESDRVLLRELNTIMEAHLVAEAATERTQTDTADGFGEGGGGEGQTSSGEEGETLRHVAAFTPKMLESSRKAGSKTMLYHGKL